MTPLSPSPELADLGRRLQAFARRPDRDSRWGDDSGRMTNVLADLRQRWGEQLADRDGPRLHRALLAFRMKPESLGWRDLRRVCRGLYRLSDWEQRRLIDDDALLQRLLTRIDALGSGSPRWRACVKALEKAQQENGGAENHRLVRWLDSIRQTGRSFSPGT